MNIGQVFEKLFMDVFIQGLVNDKICLIGIYYDDLKLVLQEKLCFVVCISVFDNVIYVDNGMKRLLLFGGCCVIVFIKFFMWSQKSCIVGYLVYGYL